MRELQIALVENIFYVLARHPPGQPQLSDEDFKQPSTIG